MKLKLRRFSKIPLCTPEEGKVVPIAGDAAIATAHMGHGRLIPLLILDTTERPDLTEVIRVNSHCAEGDVVVQWGELAEPSEHVALVLRLLRPIERTAIIQFDVMKHGVLVESILTAHMLYLQAGKPGDRFVHDLDKPKMFVEIPDTGFRPYWNKRYLACMTRRMRNEGLSRRDAKEVAKAFIVAFRKVFEFRMKK